MEKLCGEFTLPVSALIELSLSNGVLTLRWNPTRLGVETTPCKLRAEYMPSGWKHLNTSSLARYSSMLSESVPGSVIVLEKSDYQSQLLTWLKKHLFLNDT